MQAVLEQIEGLQQTLFEEKRKSRRHLYWLSGAYAVLIVWTLWDTANVLAQIQAISAPEKVAEMAGAQVRSQLPYVQRDLVAHLQDSAPKMAERLLVSAHRAIPDTGVSIKQQLSHAADDLALHMDQRVPAIAVFLKANLKNTVATAHYASDEELSKALVTETVNALDQELNQALSPSLFYGLANIRRDIDQLSGRPSASLSADLQIEKAALMNAMRLTELARKGQDSSLLAQGVRALLEAGLPGDMFKALDQPLSQ